MSTSKKYLCQNLQIIRLSLILNAYVQVQNPNARISYLPLPMSKTLSIFKIQMLLGVLGKNT